MELRRPEGREMERDGMRCVQRGRVRKRTVDSHQYIWRERRGKESLPVDSTSRANTVEYNR
jgi:hypothetical protein